MDDSAITCAEIIDAEAKSYHKKTKTVSPNPNEKSRLRNTKILYFTYLFNN